MTTAADAQEILNGIIAAEKADPIGVLESVTVNGRTYAFKTVDEILKYKNYLSRIIADSQRAAAGAPTFGRSAAIFTR